jgi:hypothetical protein
LVTNRSQPGNEVIWWLRERCGKSEQAHDVMKHDLAGGTLPSGLFGVNAAWWQMMILSHNIHSAMKMLGLGESWLNRRMKAVRFGFIEVVGRIVGHARKLILKLSGDRATVARILDARERIAALVQVPSG